MPTSSQSSRQSGLPAIYAARREMQGKAVNRLAEVALKAAGQIPQPLVSQAFLQLMCWGIEKGLGRSLQHRVDRWQAEEQLSELNENRDQEAVLRVFLEEDPDLATNLDSQKSDPEEAAETLLEMLNPAVGQLLSS